MRFVFIFLLCAQAAWCAGTEASLTLSAETDHDFYLAGSKTKIYIETRVTSALKAPDSPAPAVRNIAFVLDRSGSMAGPPIQALRIAMSTALGSLADRDIVSVVLFGSEIETLVEAKHPDQLGSVDALLAKIEAAGGSSLYDALNQGAAQLRRSAGSKTSNHLILITDGRPTKGPREFDDFARLAAVFAKEGIALSTIGIGPDFNEDLLATLARSGNGHFRFVDRPEKLPEAVQAEMAPLRTLVARDATLTIQFVSDSDKVESYGWTPAVIKENTATYQFPYIFAGQELHLLTSTVMRTRAFSYKIASIRLTWNDQIDGQPREAILPVRAGVDTSENAVRDSGNPRVVRATVDALVSGGMQDAIEQIDKGDFRRALRVLRGTRNDALSFNFPLDDPEIDAKVHQLEIYLNEVQARGMNQLDRKILRSGLFNQFDTPTTDDSSSR